MKPILFNTEMVQAIMEGRKTATRRIVKFIPGFNPQWTGYVPDGSVLYGSNNIPAAKATYVPGDILYVRETWTKLWYVDQDGYTHYDQPMYYYAADGTPDITLVNDDGFELEDQRIRWRPSIHMPKEAARIFLRVKRVTVERLQDITEEQARSEGAIPFSISFDDEHTPDNERNWYEVCDCTSVFIEIWDITINKSDLPIYGWDANPWVWVIEFERCEKPEDEENG